MTKLAKFLGANKKILSAQNRKFFDKNYEVEHSKNLNQKSLGVALG